MKNRLFLLALISLIVLGVRASELEFPKSLSVNVEYLSQNHTGDGERTFELNDEDNDGVFTADFSLGNEERDIYLQINTTDSEGKTLKWGTGDVRSPMLYGDVPYEVDLVCEDENGNVRVATEFVNWKGGQLKVSVKWNNYVNGVHYPLLTVIGPDQPEFGVFPDHLYLIGDFNDYKLPDASGDNGAIVLPNRPGAKTFRYEGSFYLNAGKGVFLVYAPEYANSKNVFYGLETPNSFTLYKSPNASQGFLADEISPLKAPGEGIVPQERHIQIREWPGGEINVLVDLDNASAVVITSKDSPVLEMPSTPRAYIRTNDVIESKEGFTSPYLREFTSCESWFSETGDENPSPDERWGALTDEVIEMSAYPPPTVFGWRVPIVKGGKPLKFVLGNRKSASLKVIYDIYNGCAEISETPDYESSVQTVIEDGYKLTDGTIVLDEAADISVYSLTGACVAKCHSDRFDLSTLPKGVYLVMAGDKTVKVML